MSRFQEDFADVKSGSAGRRVRGSEVIGKRVVAQHMDFQDLGTNRIFNRSCLLDQIAANLPSCSSTARAHFVTKNSLESVIEQLVGEVSFTAQPASRHWGITLVAIVKTPADAGERGGSGLPEAADECKLSRMKTSVKLDDELSAEVEEVFLPLQPFALSDPLNR
jgi:hypothetical protein